MFDFLSQKFSSFYVQLTGQDRLTESNIDGTLARVHDMLLEADVPLDVVREFIAQVKQEVIGKKVYAALKPAEMLMKIVHDKVLSFLGGTSDGLEYNFQIPSVIMLMGLQGAGKTSTIAKLVTYLQEQAQKKGKKRTILLASVDFYRPAAVDQLEILARQTGVNFYRSNFTDPVQAAQDIYKKYQQEGADYLFLDTAGRLQVDTQMLAELKRLDALVKPKYKLLVLDSMIGQESLAVAREFDQAVGFTGAILTKLDSDTRGGVAFAFKFALKKPILFITTGEKAQDLELFRPERITSRIIGMGDLMTLTERAQEKIKQVDQESMYRSMTKGTMTLVDFAKQIDMVNKLGSLSSIMKYMPALGGNFNISAEQLQQGELEIKKFKAIISAMTPKERVVPKILDNSRKNRIARGAGVEVADVNTLLSRFEQGQQVAKMFKKMGHFK